MSVVLALSMQATNLCTLLMVSLQLAEIMVSGNISSSAMRFSGYETNKQR
jgi:hypothetical protein